MKVINLTKLKCGTMKLEDITDVSFRRKTKIWQLSLKAPAAKLLLSGDVERVYRVRRAQCPASVPLHPPI